MQLNGTNTFLPQYPGGGCGRQNMHAALGQGVRQKLATVRVQLPVKEMTASVQNGDIHAPAQQTFGSLKPEKSAANHDGPLPAFRSEERRVGKECRCRGG